MRSPVPAGRSVNVAVARLRRQANVSVCSLHVSDRQALLHSTTPFTLARRCLLTPLISCRASAPACRWRFLLRTGRSLLRSWTPSSWVTQSSGERVTGDELQVTGDIFLLMCVEPRPSSSTLWPAPTRSRFTKPQIPPPPRRRPSEGTADPRGGDYPFISEDGNTIVDVRFYEGLKLFGEDETVRLCVLLACVCCVHCVWVFCVCVVCKHSRTTFVDVRVFEGLKLFGEDETVGCTGTCTLCVYAIAPVLASPYLLQRLCCWLLRALRFEYALTPPPPLPPAVRADSAGD